MRQCPIADSNILSSTLHATRDHVGDSRLRTVSIISADIDRLSIHPSAII